MASSPDIIFNAEDLMKSMTLTVKVVKVRRAQVRIWIMTRLLILAAWIGGVGFEIKEMEDGES